MKMIIVVLALVAVALAEVPVVQILRAKYDQAPDGSYNFGFEADNGVARDEVGELKEALDEENKPHKVVTVRGTYTYLDEEGKTQTIEYSADENGYVANGPAIPKAARR